MRKICVALICLIVSLTFASCATNAPVHPTTDQIKQLDVRFNEALSNSGLSWDATPKYIPELLLTNKQIRIQVAIDPATGQKSIHYSPEPGETSLTIGDYYLPGSFCAIFFGNSNDIIEKFTSIDSIVRQKSGGVEYYFVDGPEGPLGIGVTMMFSPAQNTICFIILNIANESKLTEKLIEKLIDDFSCIEF
jgi:hypothetical protein